MRVLLWGMVSFITLGFANVHAQADFYYDGVDTTVAPTIDFGEVVHDDVVDEPSGFMKRLLQIFGLDQYASGTNPAV